MGWMPVKADVLKVWGSTCVCRVRFADWLTELLQKFSNFPSRKNLDSPCLRRGLGICIVDKTLVKSHGQEVSKPLPIPQALTFPSTLRPPSDSHTHTLCSPILLPWDIRTQKWTLVLMWFCLKELGLELRS